MAMDRLSSEALKDILSMVRTAEEEARYLLRLYEEEAAGIAGDILMTFRTMDRPGLVEYWEDVCACIGRMRH